MALTASAYTQIEAYTNWSQQLHSITKTSLTGRTLFAKSDTQSSDYYRVCVIDINGTETGVIVGTPTNVDLADGSDMMFMDMDIAPLTADGTDGAVYYMDDVSFNHNIEANTFSIDGSRNISMNTVLEIPTDSGQEDHVAIDRIDDTHLFIVHNKWVSGGGRVNCYILTESGGTLSASSALTLDSDSDNDSKVGAVVLSSTRAFVFYEHDTNGAQVALVNISGANPTLTDGPDQIEASSQHDYNFFHKIADKLDSTHAICTYSNGTANKLRVIQNNSDVIVIGSAVTDNNSGHRCTVAAADDGTRFAVAHRTNGTISTYSVSGNTITSNGDSYTLPNNPTPNAPLRSVIAFAQMDGDDYLWVSVHGDTDDTLWAAQIRDELAAIVPLNELSLASSGTLSVLRTQLMDTLTLAGSAEFITQNIVALNTLTLAGSVETLFVQHYVVLNTLTLVSSNESLVVIPGAVAIATNVLTLAGSVSNLGIGAPGTVILDTLTLVSSAEDLGRVQTFIFSPTQIGNLRNTTHEVTARLTIFAPPVLWTGQVNGVHDRGETDIVYDSGSGSLTFVRDFLQLIIGTSPGADDIGRLRIDDTISMLLATGTITVDENAIVWLPGMYLSIEHLFPIERINPRIAGGVLYKFFDVPYTDENGQDDTDPVCVAGSDQIADLVAGSHVFNMDLSESYPTTGGVISSFALSVAPTLGAVVSFNTSTGIGTVTVDRAGYWWAICSCTDSFGNSMERFVLLRTHDSTDTDFIEVKITGYSEVWGGGVRMSVEARESISLSDVPDNAIAYLWHENKFDGVEGYVNILGVHDTILFNGYVRTDRSRSDFKTGDKSATFELTTVDGLMENLSLRSITVRLKSQPDDWWQYQLLTTGEAIWFLLRWHSTVPWRHDVIGIMTFDKFQRRLTADFEEGSLFRMANQIAFDRGVVAKITCDRLGRIHFVQDTQLLNQTQRDTIISALDIQPDDVSGTIEVIRNSEPRVHTMQISGFDYDTSGEGTPYISIIPGYRQSNISYSLPEYRGRSFKAITHQLLQTQLESNERVGRYFAQANMVIKELRIPFRGNYLSALTTIPSYGWYELNIANTDFARQLNLNRIRMLCRSITAQISSASGTLITTGIFEPEAFGPDGILGNYPTDQSEIESVEQPPLDVIEPGEAVLVQNSVEYRRNQPRLTEDTDWTQLSATDRLFIEIDPWWRETNLSDDPADVIWWGITGNIIYCHNEKDGTIVDVTPTTDPPNTWSDGPAPTVGDLQFSQILGDRWIQDRFYVQATFFNASDQGRTWIAYTSNSGTSWTWFDLTTGYAINTEAVIRNIAVNGTYLLVSYWDDGVDFLRVWTKSDFIGFRNVSINTSTAIYKREAFVQVVTDDDSMWFVYGFPVGGGTLASVRICITYTLDAGLNFSIYQSDPWTAEGDNCIALVVGEADVNGFRKVWAYRR